MIVVPHNTGLLVHGTKQAVSRDDAKDEDVPLSHQQACRTSSMLKTSA